MDIATEKLRRALESAGRLAGEDRVEEALSQLSELPAEGPDELLAEAYYQRGRLHWRLGHRSESLTDYNMAASLDPKSPAATMLEHTNDILDFFNPDLLNP